MGESRGKILALQKRRWFINPPPPLQNASIIFDQIRGKTDFWISLFSTWVKFSYPQKLLAQLCNCLLINMEMHPF